MPTVLRQEGYDVMVYTNDHAPAHVHVWKSGGEVIIGLDPVEVVRVEGMKKREASKAVGIVEAHRDFLLERWREIHG